MQRANTKANVSWLRMFFMYQILGSPTDTPFRILPGLIQSEYNLGPSVVTVAARCLSRNLSIAPEPDAEKNGDGQGEPTQKSHAEQRVPASHSKAQERIYGVKAQGFTEIYIPNIGDHQETIPAHPMAE